MHPVYEWLNDRRALEGGAECTPAPGSGGSSRPGSAAGGTPPTSFLAAEGGAGAPRGRRPGISLGRGAGAGKGCVGPARLDRKKTRDASAAGGAT